MSSIVVLRPSEAPQIRSNRRRHLSWVDSNCGTGMPCCKDKVDPKTSRLSLDEMLLPGLTVTVNKRKNDQARGRSEDRKKLTISGSGREHLDHRTSWAH